MRISVAQAVQALRQGQVMAIPTETVYGLAASLSQPQAIRHIFALKKRPPANPLIIHISSIEQAVQLARCLPPKFHELADAFWPGPLTLIVPVQTEYVDEAVRAGLETAGFRMPNHPLALEVLKQTGPLVMPSANLSGRPSATDPEHVETDFGAAFPVLDGGSCQRGVESTILYYQEPCWVVVRLGSLGPDAFKHVLGYAPAIKGKEEGSQQPLCPGQLFRHYAPQAKLLLGGKEQIESVPCILGFAERQYEGNKRVMILGSLKNPEEVAHNLYRLLRQLDQENIQTAWVDMDFPGYGIWLTIAERLKRAGEGLSA